MREPKCDWPSKDKGLSHDSRAFFSSSISSSHFLVRLCIFLDLYVRMPFQGIVSFAASAKTVLSAFVMGRMWPLLNVIGMPAVER